MRKFLKTIRKDGSIVGKEISRQRRWQLRNPEKHKTMYKKFRQTAKYKKWHREYERKQRKEKNEIIKIPIKGIFDTKNKRIILS